MIVKPSERVKLPHEPDLKSKRLQRIQLRRGPVVRFRDGRYLCKAGLCKHPPVDLSIAHRGLCAYHFLTLPDGRPRCISCHQAFAVEPLCDRLCDACHPSYRELTPFEAHVLDQIRSGKNLREATREAYMAIEGKTDVSEAVMSRKVNSVTSSPSFRRAARAALERAGIDYDFVFGILKENIEATRTIRDREGNEVGTERDYRASNTAIDLALKVAGAYPKAGKKRDPHAGRVHLAVAMIPSEQPRALDAPIYTLPETDPTDRGTEE